MPPRSRCACARSGRAAGAARSAASAGVARVGVARRTASAMTGDQRGQLVGGELTVAELADAGEQRAVVGAGVGRAGQLAERPAGSRPGGRWRRAPRIGSMNTWLAGSATRSAQAPTAAAPDRPGAEQPVHRLGRAASRPARRTTIISRAAGARQVCPQSTGYEQHGRRYTASCRSARPSPPRTSAARDWTWSSSSSIRRYGTAAPDRSIGPGQRRGRAAGRRDVAVQRVDRGDQRPGRQAEQLLVPADGPERGPSAAGLPPRHGALAGALG